MATQPRLFARGNADRHYDPDHAGSRLAAGRQEDDGRLASPRGLAPTAGFPGNGQVPLSADRPPLRPLPVTSRPPAGSARPASDSQSISGLLARPASHAALPRRNTALLLGRNDERIRKDR